MNNHDNSLKNSTLHVKLRVAFDDEPRSVTDVRMDFVFLKPCRAKDSVEQKLKTATY